MAYTTFMASPCDLATYKNLTKTVKVIYESIEKLRALETELRSLNKKHLGPTSNKITTNIDKYIKDLSEFYGETNKELGR